MPTESPFEAGAKMSWEDAYQEAEKTLLQMDESEKFTLLQGIGWADWDVQKWYYVGNTAPIPRLGIPSLNMQDAAQGFRTYWSELAGTVTCWPSLLAASATWDPGLVRKMAEGIAAEFAGKGANIILGPSVNVHRVARNGRNFEYLSGEDPYLGSRLAPAYVGGVQSQGVLAVLKHWVFNEQETGRDHYSVTVDEKTAWEVYYPPFQAAITAGAAGVMCSYNQVDGVYSCSNKEHLAILRKTMGFQGFIQSDWWANHDEDSIRRGLDQEMPGDGAKWTKESLTNDTASRDAMDQSAKRILAAIYRFGLQDSTECSPPHCKEQFMRKVTGTTHRALARTVAAESIVLLKNKDSVLPLVKPHVRSIAVVGAAAIAPAYDPHSEGQGDSDAWAIGDLYSGGGSGHVIAAGVITPLEGIRERATASGITVRASPTNGIPNATKVAQGSDVTVVVVGTTSGESKDRANLSLDHGADELVAAVAKACPNTVVLVQTPGAWVMPWKDSVASILALFLGGEETGSAWADVLFGDVAPAGRLPIMLPETEADAVEPGFGDVLTYNEGMHTSYRNERFHAAFPFGHGLTYTTFDYEGLFARPGTGANKYVVEVMVRNLGAVAARAVPQLYVEFPSVAGHPSPLLKGFHKTHLILPGESEIVVFELSGRDLSYYDVKRRSFVEAETVRVHLGESSKNLKGSVSLPADAAAAPDAILPLSTPRTPTTRGLPRTRPHGQNATNSSSHHLPRDPRGSQPGIGWGILAAATCALLALVAAAYFLRRADAGSSISKRLGFALIGHGGPVTPFMSNGGGPRGPRMG